MSNLDQFTIGYIACALWSSNDSSNDQGGDPLDQNYTAEDFSPEALEKIKADCKKFQEDNAEILSKISYLKNDSTDLAHAGHDFWLTRNGHGSGFWDGDLPNEIANPLVEASHRFGECDITVGDDGKLHI